MLVDALDGGDVEIAREAIRQGADVNHMHWDGHTLLSRSIDSLELASLLLDSGADPNLPNHDGSTSLSWATDWTVTEFLLDRGATLNAEGYPGRRTYSLHHAASKGDIHRLEVLVARGNGDRFLNAEDEMGYTPLHWAVTNGHLHAVRYLLDQGADINYMSQRLHGSPPLYLAVCDAQMDMTELLLKRGADARYHDCCHDIRATAAERKRTPKLLELVQRYAH